MLNFFKRFGLGILYVLLSPFIFAFLILWSIYNVFIFFVELVKSLKSFFKGKSFFVEFPEDIEAKKILSLEALNNQTPDTPNPPTITPTAQTPNSTVDNDISPIQQTSSVIEEKKETEISHPVIEEDNK